MPGTPTIVVDHHVPTGAAGAEGVVISSFGEDNPDQQLARVVLRDALGRNDDLLWLAAIGLIGDLDKAPFEDLVAAKKLHTAMALRDLTLLINAPRRPSACDAKPAFDPLMKSAGAKDAIARRYLEIVALEAARTEAEAAVATGKRVTPRISGAVALIGLDTPCQVHPLVAQARHFRLKDKIVEANHGYRPGSVHCAARSATGHTLVAFLQDVAPTSADENYGNGDEQATGGALRTEDWPAFLHNIGFGPVGRALTAGRATP